MGLLWSQFEFWYGILYFIFSAEHLLANYAVIIYFDLQPPTMCSYQSAIYDVTISDITAGTQLARTSVVRPYGTGEYIDIPITLTLAIREMKTYYAILGVSSVGSTSLQAIATFSMLNQC